MLLPAPVTFSTTTGLPHASPDLSASSRAVMSGATPGGKPTTILMPCSGYACANAGPAASNAAPMAKMRRSDVMAACLSRFSCDFQIGVRRCYLLERSSDGKERWDPWDRGRPARSAFLPSSGRDARGPRGVPGRINDHHHGRDSTPQLVSRGVADLRRSYDDPLVPGDVLPAATPDRQRARPVLQPDRLNPDLPIRRRRALQPARRHVGRCDRPQGSADGGRTILDRPALPGDGLFPQLLDAARLRRTGRYRQQSVAPDRHTAAGAKPPRAARAR